MVEAIAVAPVGQGSPINYLDEVIPLDQLMGSDEEVEEEAPLEEGGPVLGGLHPELFGYDNNNGTHEQLQHQQFEHEPQQNGQVNVNGPTQGDNIEVPILLMGAVSEIPATQFVPAVTASEIPAAQLVPEVNPQLILEENKVLETMVADNFQQEQALV